MKWRATAVAAAAGLAVLAPMTIEAQQPMARGGGAIEVPGVEAVREMVAEWPETSKGAAEAMIEKYGAPDGVTPEMIVWRDTGPWTH